MISWPEPVELVAGYLRSAGAEARLEQLAEPVEAPRQLAELLGCTLAQVVVAEAVDCDGTRYLTLRSGDRLLDRGKVAKVTGSRRVTVPPPGTGAVPPLPPARPGMVLVDRGLLRRSPVWVVVGSSLHLVAVAPLELVRLTQGRVEALTRESA